MGGNYDSDINDKKENVRLLCIFSRGGGNIPNRPK